MVEEISTLTIYDGSRICRKCGEVMDPVVVMYGDGKVCPTCRNLKYESARKGAMGG
jgi:hypothetical protein